MSIDIKSQMEDVRFYHNNKHHSIANNIYHSKPKLNKGISDAVVSFTYDFESKIIEDGGREKGKHLGHFYVEVIILGPNITPKHLRQSTSTPSLCFCG